MKYRNYSLDKKDDRCWTLSKEVEVTATRDITAPATGEIVHRAGDKYTSVTTLGYYGDIGKGLSGIVKDLAGTGCADIKDLAKQLSELRRDLADIILS